MTKAENSITTFLSFLVFLGFHIVAGREGKETNEVK